MWPVYEQRAAETLERYKRIYRVKAPEGIEPFEADGMAICAMADCEYEADAVASGTAGAVASAHIGSVSVSYANMLAASVDVTPAGRARARYRAAQRFLEIYRGL
jgi:hypothetical protein